MDLTNPEEERSWVETALDKTREAFRREPYDEDSERKGIIVSLLCPALEFLSTYQKESYMHLFPEKWVPKGMNCRKDI
jgi:hypothetical protein